MDPHPRRICVTTEIPCDTAAARSARRAVRSYLTAAHLDHLGDLRDTGELVVSELATNALLHTASRKITLRLRIDGDRLLITVDDAGGTPDRPTLRDLPADHGRGLALVAQVATETGWRHRTPDGRSAWASLSIT
jgi:anti-sigma regulatory factor (Ser/Thr protein kinase)